MKKLLMIVLVMSSVSIFADDFVDGYTACDMHYNSFRLNDCLDIIQGSKFQHSALNQCKRHRDAFRLNDCLGIIANKTYSEQLLESCNRQRNAFRLNDCLRK